MLPPSVFNAGVRKPPMSARTMPELQLVSRVSAMPAAVIRHIRPKETLSGARR